MIDLSCENSHRVDNYEDAGAHPTDNGKQAASRPVTKFSHQSASVFWVEKP